MTLSWWLTLLILIVFIACYALYRKLFLAEPQPPVVLLDKLASVILHQNNMQDEWAVPGVTVLPLPGEGGWIHKIIDSQAQATSTELQALQPPAPMTVLCALMSSESDMDPQCVNENLNGSNPTNNPMLYDCGSCQLKLIDIKSPGVTDYTTALAFAFDVTKCIPYTWGLLQDHLSTADSWIAGGASSNIDTRLMDRYILAVGMFKQGVTGMETIFKTGTWPTELNNFVSLESWYATQLGVPSALPKA